MLFCRRGIFFKTGEEGGGAGGGGDGDGTGGQRKAESAVVDQVHGLDDRVKRLETPFYERLFKAADEKKETPAKTVEVKNAPKPPSAFDDFCDCIDPFRMFKEEPPPVPKAEAPAADDAAA
jgi:hypothetical protein